MADVHAHHNPDFSHAVTGADKAQRRIGIAAIITFTFMIAEVAGGLFSGSLALLADAAHMLTDAGSLLLAYIGYSLAKKPADVSRTFGFSRFKILAAFTNAILLLLLAGWIIFEAVKRVIAPEPILSGVMFWVALAGLVLNIIMFVMLKDEHAHIHDHDHGDSHDHHDEHDHSHGEDLNLSGALAHVLGDLMGSVAAIVAAIVIYFSGWTMIDPILSVLVAGILIWTAIPLIRKSAHILLQGTPSGINPEEIASGILEEIPEIRAVHHIHAWTLTGDDKLLTLHVVPCVQANAITVIPDVRRVLRNRFGIDHATIELDVEPFHLCDMPFLHTQECCDHPDSDEEGKKTCHDNSIVTG